ncbi:FHA domain-containing serine/threonine-protein kinase [Aetokthonos hydrillicola Thurmond2011]|jgi:serine/threonine-protein kinase|uniref:non-specific serine/threonine protein kinase n=1 Tax=Aetokthonos hydrillicola Thurmond2011 TaxID=2712845 RepID=A0AAP5I5D7_9CYAN|nr:protein kinase [Aetokthonos hydrillicola]MBO3462765.1 protein kinase [Aetokthonos hydrillicola CCALA 1050]MBW4590660.1 protein kinase [Aetokthonos hydrillicola CCALA 1050]MDR9895000.1 FHA domain-containing serine/threonine-protein kinase [Aetokthonos hydrillicola Thurmond2011]
MLAEIDPGTLINYRYQVQEVLGQGGFGRTYLAADTQRFGDNCVLKEFVPTNRAQQQLEKSQELFEREARVLYQINHPQIPKFLAWFTDQGRVFIVQEYIDGKTYSQLLLERLSQGHPSFSEAEVIQWLGDLLPVLEYLHEIKILHRDISLDNVMFSNSQSKPVLIDFGLVKEKVSRIWYVDYKDSAQHALGTVLGRIGYASPEQIRMGQSYPSSDLYALGVCAIVLLTGKMPDLLMDQSLEWQWQSYVNISDSLAQILNKMLAEKPKQRYQSAKEILCDLQPLILPSETDVNQPLKKLHISIDQADKDRQVAEILESDDFKILEQQAKNFRTSAKTTTESYLTAETHQPQASYEESINSPSAEPEIRTSKPSPKTFVPCVPLTPEFLEHCRQQLVRSAGPFANILFDEILAKNPEITPEQLIETLAAEIPNAQRAQEFKNRVKTSLSEPTQVPFFQEQNASQSAIDDITELYRATGRLTYVQTGKQIELPKHLSVIHIGKPNNRFTPDIDVSSFDYSKIVSRIHANIYVETDGFYIEDLKSANGTFLNTSRLSPGIRYRLSSGDLIGLGSETLVTFLFQIF